MRRLARDFLCSSIGPDTREIVRCLLYIIPVAAVALTLYRDLYSGSMSPTSGNHEVLSFNMALNGRFCGPMGRLSSRYSPYLYLTSHVDLMSRPFEQTVTAQAGSLGEYCRTVTEPSAVAENSLMWLARTVLWADPVLTPDDLGRCLGACRVLIVLLFGFALIRVGASVLFTLAAVLIGCAILRHIGIRDSPYPFVLAFALLLAAAYGTAMSSRLVRASGVRLSIFALGIGILTAHTASMRTIFLPMSVVMFAVCLFTLYLGRAESRDGRRTASRLGLAALAFALGYAVYARVFVEPLRVKNDRTVSDYAYHTFAHPLVLGLAVPESDFSRREGIAWDDMTGLALARKIVPGVQLLGPQYESALLRYYGRLWRIHPREMAAVYLGKLRWDASGIFPSAASVLEQFGIPGALVGWMDRALDGVALLALALLTSAIGVHRYIGGHGGRMLIMALVGVAALSALGEAFLTHSTFLAMYSSELLFFLFFVFLILAQTGVDHLARAALGVAPATRPPHREPLA